ncbi:MAG: type II toxin-antitoxin system RelB/DinJ family antitoxin [Elusimicrobia bacterium]|nr:type II toxin-antitoxin system RelB/DinJ family antitoxin [Elusimicrobiota bacterium]
MIRSQMIHARIQPALKREAEKVFRVLGLTTSDVINALYAQVRLRKGIPFTLDIPNSKTQKAIQEARKNKGVTFKTVEEFDKRYNI